MKNFGVIVSCCRDDYIYAKGTCASARYFMKDVPLCLIVDGEFDYRELAKIYQAEVVTKKTVKSPILRDMSFGWGMTNMIAFWESPFEHFLILDADTCIWGDIRTLVDFEHYDFIIDKPKYAYSKEDIETFFFQIDRVHTLFPLFDFQDNVYVCAGVIFGSKGMLDISEYHKLIKINQQEEVFKYGNQGMINYMLFNARQRQKIRLAARDIQYIVPDSTKKEMAERFPVPPASQIDKPVIIHWAGPSKPSLFDADRIYVDPMTFSRMQYCADIGLNKRSRVKKRLFVEQVLRGMVNFKRRLKIKLLYFYWRASHKWKSILK